MLCHHLVKAALIHFLNDRLLMLHLPEWNKLDGHIRKITNFDLLKREIKTTIFLLSYFDLKIVQYILAYCMYFDITVYLIIRLYILTLDNGTVSLSTELVRY